MNLPDDFDFGDISSDAGVPVEISIHARQQWRQRLPDWVLKYYPLNRSLWHSAEIVYAPQANCDEVRLVVIPEIDDDMLLCGKHHPSKTVVATVLYADYSRLRRF